MTVDMQEKLTYCPLCDGFFTEQHGCFNPVSLIDYCEETPFMIQSRHLRQARESLTVLKSQNERLIKQLEKFMRFTGDVQLEKNMEMYSLHEQTRALISDLGIKGGKDE